MTSRNPASFDILVAGGGPAGIGAAVAASRMGARVALVERHDVLGGMGTAALVNNFCPAHLDGRRLIIGGVFAELRKRLAARKAIYLSPNLIYAMEPYNPVLFAQEARRMCEEAGVALFLTRGVAEAVVREGLTVRLSLTDGGSLEGRYAVDATGDARLAVAAGCAFTFGADSDNAVMPLTFCYKMGPIDLEVAAQTWPSAVRADPGTGERYFYLSGAREQVTAALQAGELTIPRDHVSGVISVPGEPQNATVNFGRVFIQDPTDPAQLERAEEEGRRQIAEGIRFFRKYFPGFANVEILETARQIGVRESRQVIGRYTLTGEDVNACRQFEDVIAQCCYAIDVHDPHNATTQLIELERGTHYDIPLRCLIPRNGPDNLIIAGRCISATQEAMSSFRVSPSVLAIGEAAGVTAGLAAAQGIAVGGVAPRAVQDRLEATGGKLN